MKVLVLGGTAGARHLGRALGHEAMISLAGVTSKTVSTPHRTGGFGGVAGLEQALRAHGFMGVVDATHPFAAQMSRHAFAATNRVGIPLLRLARPAWPRQPDWAEVADLAGAAEVLPAGARVFLTVGGQSLAPFLDTANIWYLTRSIDPPLRVPNGVAILQRPPFDLAHEVALMKAHRITHLVSKNAGSGATCAKLAAAALCGVQVIMVKRPRLPVVLTVESVREAVKWVENLRE